MIGPYRSIPVRRQAIPKDYPVPVQARTIVAPRPRRGCIKVAYPPQKHTAKLLSPLPTRPGPYQGSVPRAKLGIIESFLRRYEEPSTRLSLQCLEELLKTDANRHCIRLKRQQQTAKCQPLGDYSSQAGIWSWGCPRVGEVVMDHDRPPESLEGSVLVVAKLVGLAMESGGQSIRCDDDGH